MSLWMQASMKTQPKEKSNQRFPALPPPILKRYLNNQGCLKCIKFQLSVEDVEALFKVYEKDFLMFGYSPQQYKDIALKE